MMGSSYNKFKSTMNLNKIRTYIINIVSILLKLAKLNLSLSSNINQLPEFKVN